MNSARLVHSYPSEFSATCLVAFQGSRGTSPGGEYSLAGSRPSCARWSIVAGNAFATLRVLLAVYQQFHCPSDRLRVYIGIFR